MKPDAKCMVFYQSVLGLPEIQTSTCQALEEDGCEGALSRTPSTAEGTVVLWVPYVP